jgi:ketosteroid isomerase-like protein
MTTKDSPAVAVALTHIDAWSHHDWDKTRELLAPDVHAVGASTQPQFGGSGGREIIGSDEYMAVKARVAQLVEPGTVQVLSTVGDQTGAVVTVTFGIALGPGGTMVTMARACLYLIDDNRKIADERDIFFVLSEVSAIGGPQTGAH